MVAVGVAGAGAQAAARQLGSVAVPCRAQGMTRARGSGPPRSEASGARRSQLISVGAHSSAGATGWEVLGSRRSGGLTSMAVAATQPAAGVTESGSFSQSDEDLASRGLVCHSAIDDLDLDQLNSLFSKVSFPQREKAKLLRALENTQAMTWVQEAESKRLIGFARATGDKVFHAIIWDVVVDPAYQGMGLGKVLMERLMADLVKMGISNIALYAEPTVVGFYQPLGFISDPDGIRAMAYSRRR